MQSDLMPAPRYTPFSQELKARWLDLYGQGHSIGFCCDAVGITRQTYYYALEHDLNFSHAAQDARDHGTDRFEDSLRRQAIEKEQFLPTIAALRARRPSVWAEKAQSPVTPGVSITISAPSMAELAQLLGRERLQLGEPSDGGGESVSGTYDELP